MRYVALGDSISIDYYTGVEGGGAASQFACKLGATGDDFQNLTRDGNVTSAVLIDLDRIVTSPDVITLTIGGNDLVLVGDDVAPIVQRIEAIADRLARLGCAVIMNTVYDPTDGDDTVGESLGLPRDLRRQYDALNGHVRRIAAERRFLLADLEALFHGHGIRSAEPWFIQVIEPNLPGATAMAELWHRLFTNARGR